jgi:hypothetical protein
MGLVSYLLDPYGKHLQQSPLVALLLAYLKVRESSGGSIDIDVEVNGAADLTQHGPDQKQSTTRQQRQSTEWVHGKSLRLITECLVLGRGPY